MNADPATQKKGRFLAWTLRLVGVGLFAFILYGIDVSRILEHLRDVRRLPFAVATALVPLLGGGWLQPLSSKATTSITRWDASGRILRFS